LITVQELVVVSTEACGITTFGPLSNRSSVNLSADLGPKIRALKTWLTSSARPMIPT